MHVIENQDITSNQSFLFALPICKCLHISVFFFYLKKFKSSKPDAQVFWVEFFHNAEQVIIMLFIMHRHQVCTRGFGPTVELDMNKEERLMTTHYIDFFTLH